MGLLSVSEAPTQIRTSRRKVIEISDLDPLQNSYSKSFSNSNPTKFKMLSPNRARGGCNRSRRLHPGRRSRAGQQHSDGRARWRTARRRTASPPCRSRSHPRSRPACMQCNTDINVIICNIFSFKGR